MVLSPWITLPVAKGICYRFLDDVILSKKLGRLDALRLRGKLQVAAGQFAGRLARKSFNVVTQHAYSMCGVDLDEPTVSALRLHRTFIARVLQLLMCHRLEFGTSSQTHVLNLRPSCSTFSPKRFTMSSLRQEDCNF